MTEFIMPKMGESVFEATVIKWLKNVGDSVKKDESILEVATDKVDTEVPSSTDGIISKILIQEGAIAKIGDVLAFIEPVSMDLLSKVNSNSSRETQASNPINSIIHEEDSSISLNNESRFFSPLVLNIARQENLPLSELENLKGTGKNNRVTKYDIIEYLNKRGKTNAEPTKKEIQIDQINALDQSISPTDTAFENKTITTNEIASGVKIPYHTQMAHEIVEMDRMRKIIAQRMIDSRKISAHVTSFVEADVSNMVLWRGKIKHEFMKREGEGMTYTPIFIDCVAKALKDFPLLNSSVYEDKIIVKKDINIGIAVALEDGNLIVPVVKNADRFNITGLTKAVNQLIKKAKNNKLTADDLSDGTYTISNVGTFGNVMGTPIIVQPQVGILALGTIQKKPAVIETEYGDTIGIRHLMYLSHSYDHRIIDGSLGGAFVRKVADYLENWDLNKSLS